MKKKKIEAYNIFIRIVDVLAWGLILSALILISEARPEQENILTFFYSRSVRTRWLASYISAAYAMLLMAMASTAIGLIINLILHFRNKKCPVSKGMTLGLIVSMLLAWLVTSNLI